MTPTVNIPIDHFSLKKPCIKCHNAYIFNPAKIIKYIKSKTDTRPPRIYAIRAFLKAFVFDISLIVKFDFFIERRIGGSLLLTTKIIGGGLLTFSNKNKYYISTC